MGGPKHLFCDRPNVFFCSRFREVGNDNMEGEYDMEGDHSIENVTVCTEGENVVCLKRNHIVKTVAYVERAVQILSILLLLEFLQYLQTNSYK